MQWKIHFNIEHQIFSSCEWEILRLKLRKVVSKHWLKGQSWVVSGNWIVLDLFLSFLYLYLYLYTVHFLCAFEKIIDIVFAILKMSHVKTRRSRVKLSHNILYMLCKSGFQALVRGLKSGHTWTFVFKGYKELINYLVKWQYQHVQRL